MKLLFRAIVLLLFVTPLQAQPPQSIVFDKIDYDFGKIHEERGKVEATFYFTNMGKTPLVVEDVHTSCGCTVADYTKDTVRPNHMGFVKAIYDPSYRTGSFAKSVMVRNSGFPQLTTLTIRGEVLPKPKGPEDWYPTLSGQMRFSTNHFAFGDVYNNRKDTLSVKFYNASEKTISLTGIYGGPSFVNIVPSAGEVAPGKYIKLTATLDGTKADDLGYIFEELRLYCTDTAAPEKRLYISANMLQYFPKLNKKDSAAAPHIVFSTLKHSWGEVKEETQLSTNIKVTNAGKKPLKILRTKASCGCTVTRLAKTTIAPGETVDMEITFDTRGRVGRESKTITVISNDPYHSNEVITVTADIYTGNR